MVLPARLEGTDAALRVTPGMEVYDTFDHKLGTVAHVHDGPAPAGGAPGAGEVVEVKTGFLGLGKHLFIPRSAVRDVTEGGVFVAASREEIGQRGWDQRPGALGAASPLGDETTAPAPEAGMPQGTVGALPTTWDDVAPRYRAQCEQRYGESARWETYQPRYRFAWDMGRLSEFAGAPWDQAQTELRRRWEVLHPEAEWETVAETVRDAWMHDPDPRRAARTP